MTSRILPPDIAKQMPFRRIEVAADDVALSVVDDGPRNGSPVLFLHGNPVWSFVWRKLLTAAKVDGHRVIAPDHAGFGASDKPEDPRYYSLTRHVDNLVEVARALDLRELTLVLHDWGGPIGMGFAVREPERVRSIVVANTVAFAPTKPRAFTTWHKVLGSPAGYQMGVALNLVERSAMRFGVEKPLPKEVKEAYDWPMREKGARVAAGRFVQMVPDGPDHPEAATLRAIEAGFKKLGDTPVRVLWADKDPVMRPKLAHRWEKAPLNVVKVQHVAPDAGHFWQEDAPEAFLPGILEAARSG